MSARRLLALAAMTAGVAAGGAAVAGCGGEDAAQADDGARLAWHGAPLVFAPAGLPQDRVLTGRVRNAGTAPVEIRVDELHALLRAGGRTPANGRFTEAFGHGLYGPGGPPAPFRASRYDQRRLGEIVTIAPGKDKPLTVAWRGEADALEVGRWRLDVPPAQTSR